MLNVRRMTYAQMAQAVRDIREEVKHRNSIGVNMYTQYLDFAVFALQEISRGEQRNFTSECGPRESKPRVKKSKGTAV
jgi:hypothetical protein